MKEIEKKNSVSRNEKNKLLWSKLGENNSII